MATPIQFHQLHANDRIHGPRHQMIECGACGKTTNARVVAMATRTIDGAEIFWYICACPKEEPCVTISDPKSGFTQHPLAKPYQAGDRWPVDLIRLYDEAATAYAAGAYTAAAIVARKLLMACACVEGDGEGKQFAEYVDYIVGSVLTFPKAKDSINRIRKIGNDANHKVQFVTQEEAKRAMEIVTYMLNTIYSLPTA